MNNKFWNDNFKQRDLNTERLELESVSEDHSNELFELLSDEKLHTYLPSTPPTLEQQKTRCLMWSKRQSPDKSELWLNWVAREKSSKKIIAHIQAGLKDNGIASVAYVVASNYQRKGFAYEAMRALFFYLRDDLGASEVKIWSDTRNLASHALAKKLGMKQTEFIRNADFFKNQTSDEYVFSLPFIRKIAVIGNGGGGKTTLSKVLAKKYLLKLTHVDSIQYLAGMKKRAPDETSHILDLLTQERNWLIDGFGSLEVMKRRFDLADKIVFVDFPLWRHYWWCTKRQIKSLWSPRKELPEGCNEATFSHTIHLYKILWRVHFKIRPNLIEFFQQENIKDKVITIRTLTDWNKIYSSEMF